MLVDTFHSLCTDMRVPRTKDKAQGPTTSLVFLGLVIDTNQVQICIPETTFQKNIVSSQTSYSEKNNYHQYPLQCIVGKLVIIAWDIPESRAYKRFFLNR